MALLGNDNSTNFSSVDIEVEFGMNNPVGLDYYLSCKTPPMISPKTDPNTIGSVGVTSSGASLL